MKIKRIFAYLLDIFFVSLISSLIVMIPIFNYNAPAIQEKTNEMYDSLLTTGSSDPDEDILIEKLYDLEKESSSLTVVTAFVTFIYFGVIGFINNGQTLGKMITKLRVVPVKDNKLNPGLYIIRTLLITSIIPQIINIASLSLMNANTWYNLTSIVSQVQEFFFLIILGFMIFRDDERGLHDIICQTKVIEAKKVD